jgi:hypothetical protein
VHHQSSRRNGLKRVVECFMLRRKATSSHHMMLKYGLENAWKLDNFQKMSKKEYNFDNDRSITRWTISHINKFLVSQDLDRGGVN